jgi:DNA-binding transcriptional regulator LsrR (DeoR family)
MEKVKEVLYFINAHRDGCTGSLVSESLKMTTEEVLNLFKQMHKEGLIEINMTNEPTDEEFLNSLVLISGAYSHPDYSDIF